MSMRGRWIVQDGRLIPVEEYRRPIVQRSTSFPMPMLRRDDMDAIRNPVDGRIYDSKSQYERAVRSRGARIVGNDDYVSKPEEPKGEVGRDLMAAWEQLS